jgi:hypothetical protein
MAMQAGASRSALIAAGASEEKAEKAAEEAAGFDTRLAGIETRVSVLTWMVGANVGLTILALSAVVTISAKLGDISGQLAQLSRVAH